MSASSSSPPKATRPRHFLRYSLRGLLIFLTLACVGVWYWFRVPFAQEIDHSQTPGFFFTETAGPVRLGREIQRYRRVLRGNPIREGRTEFFDRDGRRVGEENWHEGQLHGPMIRWYTTGKVRERGQFRLGRMEGTWENFDELGNPTLRSSYERGVPDGEWQRFEQGKVACTIRFEQGEATQIDGRAANDLLGRAYRRGEIEDERIRNLMVGGTLMMFTTNARINHFADFISENYAVNVLLDRKCGAHVNSSLLATDVDHITAGAMLVLQCQPHDLTATYRFGTIVITTNDDAASWVDRTGVNGVLKSPPKEVPIGDLQKLRVALEKPIQFEFLDTPFSEVVKHIAESYQVPLDCDASLKDVPVTSLLRGISLQNGLGALCDKHDLRVRWKDGRTLLIEAQEGTESQARRAGRQ